MNAIPDLAVEFEAKDGYAISPPPPVVTPPPKRNAPKRNVSLNDSPTLTPPLKTSPQSSATTLSENEIVRSSTRRSNKSLPTPATDNSDQPQRVSAPLSFVYGLLLGVLPFLIVIRFCMHKFRGDHHDKPQLQERWFKYGRSTGLLLLLAVVIVVLIQLT